MSVNSSSSSNASHPSYYPSSSITILHQMHICLTTTVGAFNITIFTITTILVLLPLCILVLYLGHQQWRQRRSSTAISHCDVFTYHMVVTELLNVFGSSLGCCGVHAELSPMVAVGIYLCVINLTAQMLFHLLTCVERYLAVVHPITYLSLRNAKGIRLRNITIGCVWLLSFAGTGLLSMTENLLVIIIVCFCFFIFLFVSFCSLSVLCVPIHPGPGEGGGDRQQVDQSKLRAFYTIMVILGVLFFRFGGNVLSTTMFISPQLGETGRCNVWSFIFWFSLPSSLVLPLLFLQRAGKLPCC